MQVNALPLRSSAARLPPCRPDVDGKRDPVLELWVDVEHTPAIVRLSGTIDGQTGSNVRGVVKELLNEGYSSIAMEIDELELPAVAGYSALIAIEELVRQAGGRLHWSSLPSDTCCS
jgi:anti-anti-sigma regulatory factor